MRVIVDTSDAQTREHYLGPNYPLSASWGLKDPLKAKSGAVAYLKGVNAAIAVSIDDFRRHFHKVSINGYITAEQLQEGDRDPGRRLMALFRRHGGAAEPVACVQRGTIVGLVGPSGGGKSTLLALVAELLAPNETVSDDELEERVHSLVELAHLDGTADKYPLASDPSPCASQG